MAIAEVLERYRSGAATGLCQGCGAETAGAPWHNECLAAAEAQERAARQAAARESRYVRAGIPAHFERARLEAIDDTSTAVDAARRWAAGELRGVYLFGSYGVGKSHLAAAAAWARLDRESVRWISVAELERDLRRSYGEDEQLEAQRRAAAPGAVVLDDLDKVSRSEPGKRLLFDLVDDRVNDGDSLIVTTNLAPSELAARFDEAGRAVISRLAGHCELIEVSGVDRRLARARAA